MSPEDIKALRQELGVSHGELAAALKIEAKTLVLWESGELFPTKRHVDLMQKLKSEGPGAVPKLPRGRPKGTVGVARLADPALWTLVRKLCEHPELFEKARALAESYSDPAP